MLRIAAVSYTHLDVYKRQELAAKGVEEACAQDKGLLAGLNCYTGYCTFPGVAEALELEYTDPVALLAQG